jgi:hypothetical protein
MRRALDLIHYIIKESVTESTTKFGFDLSDLNCGMEDDGEMVRSSNFMLTSAYCIKHFLLIALKQAQCKRGW